MPVRPATCPVFAEVGYTRLINLPEQLGGQNVIVQIDESLFRHKPNYHRGRAPASDQWVSGMCDTSTTTSVGHVELVADQQATTDHPARGEIVIHSDQWATYRQLHNDTNFTYKTVNLSLNFVDPATEVHTQPTESYWAKVKLKFKAMKDMSSHQLPEMKGCGVTDSAVTWWMLSITYAHTSPRSIECGHGGKNTNGCFQSHYSRNRSFQDTRCTIHCDC